MSATDSDDDYLNQRFLHNKFEICSVPRLSTLFECVAAGAAPTERGTFASTPVHALRVFIRENPLHGENSSVQLRVYSTLRVFHVFDLDPLQYTRAYPSEMLSLYAGSTRKSQRQKVLGEIYAYLLVAARDRRLELDAFADLSQAAACGFKWDADLCVDEVAELHPVLAGVHYCARHRKLFDPRLLRLLRRRITLHDHGTIDISPDFVKVLGAAPLQYPSPKLWSLGDPEESTERIHSVGLPEPTGFTSLKETGWRTIVTLRDTLLQHAHTLAPERHTNEQVVAYTVLLNRCSALTATTEPVAVASK